METVFAPSTNIKNRSKHHYYIIMPLVEALLMLTKKQHITFINCYIIGRERLLSNEEQSVRVLMRRFARFLDAETTEKLIQSFLNEKRLIKRIKCLQTYHCLGIKTLAGGELYERLREKREKTRERMKASLDLIIKNNKSIASTEQQNATISCTNTELQGQQAMCSTGKTKYSLTPLNITY
ncbi:PREDICTED: uncharacterized protein LOC109591904 isoform X2 [Amphimedon queenslandica]|uniref:Uncharacterized protein n=1 Tax=Amphimedon queenslandica TaxID=400682 RepID=A0AAN0K1P2_AMPQE|nr:PREDICTED: uncharacterized protein LOC109591904 isoform X2 [Amphimedon queenslandica]|eukprot:XP_019863065.1 PREDICTED: uncharacterized protein LOC109591904 isoform X2 [Amphimedon queenslandica]